ncbi:MAG: carboxypeptidase M32 [Rhodanobacteraceae bacterium]
MPQQFDRLKERLATIQHLHSANALLSWDQQTYMPSGGAVARAGQMSTLGSIAHELFISNDTAKLLGAADAEVGGLPPESDEASLVRVARRDFDKACKVPVELVVEMTEHAVTSHQVWVRARADSDFGAFAPYLERTVELSRRMAEYLGYVDEIYDALLDQFEPGVKTATVARIFGDLKPQLVDLVASISQREEQVSDALLHQPFDEAAQETFGKMIATRLGYDFNRGRQDRTVHPFATSFSRNDVRITTRFEPNFLNAALFGTMHETGHALYEQNVGESLEGSLLADGASMGMHESQSRLWENVVGRSLGFWSHYYAQLQDVFPQLAGVNLDSFYRAINKVQPSAIRVEADEVTYNLHIMIRFEMEREMLEGVYPTGEAPEVWKDKMESYLGVRPSSDREGILQDVHWSGGMLGYFPTYALGNVLSVQIYEAAVQANPSIPDQMERGDTSGLLAWLTEHIYRYGRKFEPADLIERATGQPLHPEPYVRYLKNKFGAIYGLGDRELETAR